MVAPCVRSKWGPLHILPDMPYDTIREIQGVMEIGTAPLLLAAATGRRPWRDAAEMLDAARRRQGSVSAGTSGSGLSNLFVVLASAQTGAGQPKSGGPERIDLRRAIFRPSPRWASQQVCPKNPRKPATQRGAWSGGECGSYVNWRRRCYQVNAVSRRNT